MTWIQTYTNAAFDFENLEANSICIEDIAHALANQVRFNGHTRKFYSVAQHSWWVSKAMERTYTGKSDPEPLLVGLLHDASEAYLGDCVRPLKQRLPEFQNLEAQVEALIWRKFDLTQAVPECWAVVKKYDNAMLATERRDLLGKSPRDWTELGIDPLHGVFVYPVSPERSEGLFLDRFHSLQQARYARFQSFKNNDPF